MGRPGEEEGQKQEREAAPRHIDPESCRLRFTRAVAGDQQQRTAQRQREQIAWRRCSPGWRAVSKQIGIVYIW